MADTEIGRQLFDLADASLDRSTTAEDGLRARGRGVVPDLLEAIWEDKLGGVAMARILLLLAEVDPASALDPALRLLDDPRSHVAMGARDALGQIPGPLAEGILRGLADGPEPDAAAHARILLDARREAGSVEGAGLSNGLDEPG